MKTEINKAKLITHLKEQYILLKGACNRYDSGDLLEAKNIATRIRLFAHTTKSSISLIDQIALISGKDIKVHSYQKQIPQGSLFFIGPTLRVSREKHEMTFVPMFDFKGRPVREITLKEWWNEAQIICNTKVFSRKDLILTYTNQDGGTHVDPTIDDDYKRLTEGDMLNIKNHYQQNGMRVAEIDIPHVVVRESAHFLTDAIEMAYGEYLE